MNQRSDVIAINIDHYEDNEELANYIAGKIEENVKTYSPRYMILVLTK